jgi:hypothetical protein
VTGPGSTRIVGTMDEWAEIVTRNAFDGKLPATLPVHWGSEDGPVIGTAEVTGDDAGLAVVMRIPAELPAP